ncbi:MAG: ice-binding family protein [Gemmatimonas sp.]
MRTPNTNSPSFIATGIMASFMMVMVAGCANDASNVVNPLSIESQLDRSDRRVPLGPAAVNLRTAGDFVILSKAGISTTGTTSILGNIGVSPIAATAITGFGLILDRSNTFSRSARVTGKVYAASYAAPTPTMLTRAVGDMQTAYTDAAGRSRPNFTELGSGNIGGLTLRPGLYKWSSAVTIPTNVTLAGSENDVWIFQIAQTLTISNGKQVILSGGARARNIVWQVAGKTTLGTTSVFNGTILGATAIVLQTGARLNGKALAQTAVTLDASTVR